MKTEMTREKADALITHIVDERRKWGKQYTASDVNFYDLLDAIVLMGEAVAEDGTRIPKGELATANRRTGAANARAEKAFARVSALEEQLREQGVQSRRAQRLLNKVLEKYPSALEEIE